MAKKRGTSLMDVSKVEIEGFFTTESLFEEFDFHHFYEEKWNEKSISDLI